jgi:hypothetical protein
MPWQTNDVQLEMAQSGCMLDRNHFLVHAGCRHEEDGGAKRSPPGSTNKTAGAHKLGKQPKKRKKKAIEKAI